MSTDTCQTQADCNKRALGVDNSRDRGITDHKILDIYCRLDYNYCLQLNRMFLSRVVEGLAL